MPTIADLGRMFKHKYPGAYDDMTDAEVGRMFKAAHRPAYDDYVEEGLEVRQSPAPVSKPSAQLMNPVEAMSATSVNYQRPPTEATLQRLWEHYNPNKGQFTSWWQRIRSASRGELLGKVNEEQLEVIRMGAILSEEVRKGQKSEVEFKMFLARNAEALNELIHNNHLRALAMNEGLPVQESIQQRVADRESQRRINEKREETEIARKDYEEREHIRITIQAQEAVNTFKAIAQYRNLTYDQLEEIRGRIFTLIKEEDQIERSNELSPQAKGAMLDEIREMKQMYKEILNAQRRRLVDAGRGEEAGGIDSIADLISSSTVGRKATRQPVPAYKPGDDE